MNDSPPNTGSGNMMTLEVLPSWSPRDLPRAWMAGTPVVYALTNPHGAVYIGSSIAVRRRLVDHFAKAWWFLVASVTIIDATGVDLDDFERTLVEEFRPPFNRAGVTSPWIPRRP